VRWAFGSYRDICPPEYVLTGARSDPGADGVAAIAI